MENYKHGTVLLKISSKHHTEGRSAGLNYVQLRNRVELDRLSRINELF